MKAKRLKTVPSMSLEVLPEPVPIEIVKGTNPTWNLYEHGITQGLINRFLSCPEKHRLSMVEGYTSVRVSEAIQFGNIVHTSLEEFYKAQKTMKAPMDWGVFISTVVKEVEDAERWKLVEDIRMGVAAEQDLEETYGLAEIVLRHYVKAWIKDYSAFKWENLEQEFSVPYNHPNASAIIPLRGKIDGVFRSGPANHLWMFETKTKGRIEEESISDKLNFDLQVMLYLHAIGKLYGEAPRGVVYNVIRRPGQRRGAKESLKTFLDRVEEDIEKRPEHYFVRFDCSILPEELILWEGEFSQMVGALIAWDKGWFRYKNSDACNQKWGTCEFIKVCSRRDYEGLKRKETVFPELVNLEIREGGAKGT